MFTSAQEKKSIPNTSNTKEGSKKKNGTLPLWRPTQVQNTPHALCTQQTQTYTHAKKDINKLILHLK